MSQMPPSMSNVQLEYSRFVDFTNGKKEIS